MILSYSTQIYPAEAKTESHFPARLRLQVTTLISADHNEIIRVA